MQHIQGGDRNQTLLLPVAVDDYVGRENPVRFIEAFVDQCDLQEAGFRRVQPKDTGRPGYDPADLLKLYIYGYVNRVRSSRRLEAETTRNLEVIWLLRGLRPDFKTIAVLERMEARLAARPEILKQRREIAEHPFGSIKQWMNQGTFLLRGLEKVRAEFSLTALAYNFIRAVNIVGVASLLKAV